MTPRPYSEPSSVFAVERPDWWDRANCVGTDVSLFFPGRGRNETLREAQAVCAGCECRPECLAFALDHNIQYGVFGGCSERERRKMRSARGRRRRAS